MYFQTLPQLMTSYQKLIYCWSAIFEKRNQILPLDNMNYNRLLFQSPVDPISVMETLPFEPGYFSPDGSSELDRLVRFYELNRLNNLRPHLNFANEKIINGAGVGFGNGTSNVVFNILRSLIELRQNEFSKLNVIVALPNYPVYYSQLLGLNIEVRVLECSEENFFLPTADGILELCDANTIAVLMTSPNNPAQHTLKNDFPIEMLLEKLKHHGTTLVIDSIYREMDWNQENDNLEIMLRVTNVDNWVVVYGPSKDTPFFAGYRLGYWIGDPKIKEKYRELVSATENCLNSYSILMFAILLLLKGIVQRGSDLTETDLELLNDGCCGWSVNLNLPELYENMFEFNWVGNFQKITQNSYSLQKQSLTKIADYLKSSQILSNPINGNLGNLILTGVHHDYFNGSSFDLFEWCLENPKLGILPGSVFGINKINNEFIPFRITTIHDTSEQIINGLETLEFSLKKFANK